MKVIVVPSAYVGKDCFSGRYDEVRKTPKKIEAEFIRSAETLCNRLQYFDDVDACLVEIPPRRLLKGGAGNLTKPNLVAEILPQALSTLNMLRTQKPNLTIIALVHEEPSDEVKLILNEKEVQTLALQVNEEGCSSIIRSVLPLMHDALKSRNKKGLTLLKDMDAESYAGSIYYCRSFKRPATRILFGDEPAVRVNAQVSHALAFIFSHTAVANGFLYEVCKRSASPKPDTAKLVDILMHWSRPALEKASRGALSIERMWGVGARPSNPNLRMKLIDITPPLDTQALVNPLPPDGLPQPKEGPSNPVPV